MAKHVHEPNFVRNFHLSYTMFLKMSIKWTTDKKTTTTKRLFLVIYFFIIDNYKIAYI